MCCIWLGEEDYHLLVYYLFIHLLNFKPRSTIFFFFINPSNHQALKLAMEAPPAAYETSLEIMEENPPLPVQLQPNLPVAASIPPPAPLNENLQQTIQPHNHSLPGFIPPAQPSSMSVTADPDQPLGSGPLIRNVIEAYCGQYAMFICMEMFKAMVGVIVGSVLVSVSFASFF